jgi:hypothetical protein
MRRCLPLGMRTIFALMAVAALAAGGSSAIFTSHRTVAWGWGCGGHCAVNVSGQSETTLGNDPPVAHLEDKGTLTVTHRDPGGTAITTTRWTYAFHGTRTAGSDRRQYQLRTDVNECRRTDQTSDAGKPPSKKETPCPGPPQQWKLVCERRDIQIQAAVRPAWVCFPPEHMAEFGTEFPWVFGIGEPITTVISGEPHPRTTYQLSPPPGRHD